MAIHHLKLKAKENIANDTMAFHFEKPDGFEYKAGQFGEFYEINPKETDDEGTNRPFSIASAPFEQDLIIASRMRDTAFKRNLKNMSVGDEIKLDGPYGSFTLHKDTTRPAVFLTGGIGITPARSIIKEWNKEKLEHQVFLFYSNHTLIDAAFLEEFRQIEKENPSFKLIAIMTQDSGWKGEKERITKEMLEKYIQNLELPVFYLSGPGNMVSGLNETLINSGINEDNIRFEEFPY